MPHPGPEILTPEIRSLESDDTYGKFAIEPLERGYGITIGNPMRRMLLSSVDGTAITWVKIDGILHEYSSIPHMKEEVMEFLLNVKAVRIRSVTGRPGKMRLEIRGEGRVCAGDIATSADFEIVNPRAPPRNPGLRRRCPLGRRVQRGPRQGLPARSRE